MIFLIEYHRAEGRLVTFRSFEDSQRLEAESFRLAVELDLHDRGVYHEVVLLEANDEATLRRTHSRYFERLSEMGGSGFTVLDVSWQFKVPSAHGDTGGAKPPIRTGIGQITLRCNRCETEWRASKSTAPAPGSFLATIGYVIPTCPKCGQSVPIANSELERQERKAQASP